MNEELLGVNILTALFTLANTIAIYLVGKKFLYAPIMNMIEARQKEIDDLYADAGAARQNAQALEAEYTQKLAVAAQTGEEMVQQAVARGQKREDEIIRQASARADAILEKANADICQEKKKAINDAKDEISVIAIAIAEKVVNRELNAADHEKLVDQFIDDLGESL